MDDTLRARNGANPGQQPIGPDNQADSGQGPLPKISLPKGGGAIHGIGEKFRVNPVNGTSTLSIPIAASPGRNGFGPQVSLSYDSGAGNGPFGFGWGIALPSVTRKTDKGIDDSRIVDCGTRRSINGNVRR